MRELLVFHKKKEQSVGAGFVHGSFELRGESINKTRDFRIDLRLRFCGQWLETSKRIK